MMRRSLYLSGAVGAALLSLVAFNAVPAHAAALLITETANSEDDLLFAGPEENTAETGGTHQLDLITTSPSTGFPDPFTEVLATQPTDPASELALVQSLVDPNAAFANGTGDASKFEDPDGGNALSLVNFDPGFSWVYAFVKPDGFWVIYQNLGADTLTTHLFDHAISHVTFFVPLPAAAWLLLTALAGLFGWRRWFGGSQPATATA